MIKLYTTNVDRYRGYGWSRNIYLEQGVIGGINSTGLIIRARCTNPKHVVELRWGQEMSLGIRGVDREVTLDRHFKPELPINSLMLEICDGFLNKSKVN